LDPLVVYPDTGALSGDDGDPGRDPAAPGEETATRENGRLGNTALVRPGDMHVRKPSCRSLSQVSFTPFAASASHFLFLYQVKNRVRGRV
jgi:hypothetical protein